MNILHELEAFDLGLQVGDMFLKHFGVLLETIDLFQEVFVGGDVVGFLVAFFGFGDVFFDDVDFVFVVGEFVVESGEHGGVVFQEFEIGGLGDNIAQLFDGGFLADLFKCVEDGGEEGVAVLWERLEAVVVVFHEFLDPILVGGFVFQFVGVGLGFFTKKVGNIGIHDVLEDLAGLDDFCGIFGECLFKLDLSDIVVVVVVFDFVSSRHERRPP